jgi:hypothetical protein
MMRIIQAFTKQNMMTTNQTHFGMMKSRMTNKAPTSTEKQVGIII